MTAPARAAVCFCALAVGSVQVARWDPVTDASKPRGMEKWLKHAVDKQLYTTACFESALRFGHQPSASAAAEACLTLSDPTDQMVTENESSIRGGVITAWRHHCLQREPVAMRE